MNRLSVYSMFAGIGGIDLGFERTGRFETVAFAEVDPFACRVLAHHWPSVPNVGDVTSANYEANPDGTRYIEQSATGDGYWLPPVDVIAAGFPCQDISVAGKQEGIKHGERSGLWREVVRAIRNLRPRYVVLENVAAITSSNDGRDHGTVLGELAALGFDAEWACVRAADVGAPHLRARWFCIAWRDVADADVQRRAQSPSAPVPTGPGNDPRGAGRATGSRAGDVADTDRAGSQRRDRLHNEGTAERVRRDAGRPGVSGAELANTDSNGWEQSPNRESCQDRGNGQPVREPQRQCRGAQTGRVFSSPGRADAWDTGIIGPGGRLIEPSVRLLAHGVPERVAQLRGLGNAVVPQVAEHVAQCLIRLHDQQGRAVG